MPTVLAGELTVTSFNLHMYARLFALVPHSVTSYHCFLHCQLRAQRVSVDDLCVLACLQADVDDCGSRITQATRHLGRRANLDE